MLSNMPATTTEAQSQPYIKPISCKLLIIVVC